MERKRMERRRSDRRGPSSGLRLMSTRNLLSSRCSAKQTSALAPPHRVGHGATRRRQPAATGRGQPGPSRRVLPRRAAEVPRACVEGLRESLEDGTVTIVRGRCLLHFRSRIQLLAAMNSCPCGWLGYPQRIGGVGTCSRSLGSDRPGRFRSSRPRGRSSPIGSLWRPARRSGRGSSRRASGSVSGSSIRPGPATPRFRRAGGRSWRCVG